ncbi:hypothetical protein TWF106_007498 [Orbilia oligospora]|uniref:AAA+ ATPase domain-containing protein n=1 Tax=Orbilia oligospora TaxID=2813651 RepID=A0A6G1MBS6_ORBOL|nr:hypothetical protein TWF191_002754 [Orbilia oligospora]KAF3228465.1 hypothetical protein TWF106_007498 [Orbilia oligospora]KAF3253033.1 hypothetical protein TWF192_004318 [Orbilia oligospora]
MGDQEDSAKRLVRQTKLFNAIIHGHRELKSPAEGDRFLESLCAQEDVAKCVESVVAATGGINAVAKSFRFSGESVFLNGVAASVLHRLAHPSLKQLYAGEFLNRVLEAIVEPPTFWNTFVDAHQAQILNDTATHAFAWLLFEILSSRSSEGLPDVRDVAERVTGNESLINGSSLEIRNLGQKIKHLLSSTSSNGVEEGPGGRHDNDFVDYRKVKLLPTTDEFASRERPFYRRADAVESVDDPSKSLVHLDNQFRLLREDFLRELRDDFQIAIGQKKGKRRFILEGLEFNGVDCGAIKKRKLCSVKLQCNVPVPQLKGLQGVTARKFFLRENKKFIKHDSFGCLINGDKIVAFANVDRDEDLLAQEKPVIVLRIEDEQSFNKVLYMSKTSSELKFVQVDTAFFAYSPILKRLQSMKEIPLRDQLLGLGPGSNEALSGIMPTSVVNSIRINFEDDLQSILGTSKSVKLDAAQAKSLLAGLRKKVSLIQGPPGTGKSFIGALIAKALHDHTTETILVQTYTNHALDQFLEDLLNIGIPNDSIVRLGSKSTPSTKALSLFEQQNTYKESGPTYRMRQDQKSQAESYHDSLIIKVNQYMTFRPTEKILLDYLEFSDDSEFFDAFVVPENEEGMTVIGAKGKKITAYYLFQRWISGLDAGVFHHSAKQQFPTVWAMDTDVRATHWKRWIREVFEEQISEIGNLMRKYNECQEQLKRIRQLQDSHIIEKKRIIGCTTTAAAMHTDQLQKASPGVVLVEEAGEILESHILTAMTPNTKQLVLIGDHKQLRPKVNNHALTVEKGDGYNLNQSLFERLVLSGVPHITLNRQHRMRPEISSLVRNLTYPELEDAEGTNGRPRLRGFQDSVIFVSHNCPELNATRIADRRDDGSNLSKENKYEAEIIIKCVRYLGQQGYGTNNLVVLTPYLGQLCVLRETLSKDNDPVLNDLDSFELIRAGLLSPAGAGVGKRQIKISTIDNYQGEESDIVIVSLTRSNSTGDIGFMASPQRVNVLLSRARNALIMIGNADTFMNSCKGKDVWIPLMEQLKKDGHVYDGFPVQCEQHPEKKALLKTKEEFEIACPDGGCSEPCGIKLNCGQHKCPHRCHQLQDHTKMECPALIKSRCSRKKHNISRECHDKAAASCRKCEAEDRDQERRQKRDHKLDQERQAKQVAYARKLAEIEDEIDHQNRLLREKRDDRDRENGISQKQQDLASLKTQVKRFSESGDASASSSGRATSSITTVKTEPAPQTKPTAPQTKPTTPETKPTTPQPSQTSMKESENNEDDGEWEVSESKDDWAWQKEFEGAENEALDSLMEMIGLESVKQEFLGIKAKVDAVVRQGASLKDERFGAALLGNPGTGKTTVARLYAKFLVKVGALPGSYFHESSGSSLANDGVSACQKHIEKILEEGGGVFFIDEAYQLVSGNSYGGKAVLDYLLAEIENLTGKIVFILAGYHKQMEAFFAHNPGIPSRIPKRMEFQDYNDKELQTIFCHYLKSKYKGSMKVEDGMAGLYVRIVARRIGRGRGRDGFGNAREVQNRLAQITERQAKRLRKERRKGLKPDDNLLTKEDLIGPEPSAVLKNNAAWAKLQKLIGLEAVKTTIRVLLDGLQFNYQRELDEKPLVQYSLNRCFIGSPGTGKTSVAKLYGRILADIGLLSDGEVVVKNPADFVGSVLGASEANTKAILASTVGKVLIIDEAYMLAGGTDPYKTAVIDTIVAEVQSTPGEDRCVLLLGYKDQMEEMFRDVNPGLARRFPLESAFVFEDFSDDELRRILDLKLKEVGFSATDQAKNIAIEVLSRARNRPNFGNAGEVDILLDRAKALHQKHMSAGETKNSDIFDAVDFDPDFDRGTRAATNLGQLFQDVVGCENVIKQFEGYQTTAANMKALGMDPREQIPFNFLFKGPPGTGKTTTAQKMGKVFYDMGFLSQAKVEQCSTTDMIGEYVGHTGPKVKKLLEKAMGKVLFIDEAYRLAEGGFATEAMDELVSSLTDPKYAQKLIVILAGYDEDIDRLMSINPGLTSRFPESVVFNHMEPESCLKLLTKVLDDLKKKSNAPLDLSVLQSPTAELRESILCLFKDLSRLKSWGNARDVKSLAKNMFRELISQVTEPITGLVLTEDIILKVMGSMLAERARRNEAAGTTRHGPNHITPIPRPMKQNAPDQRAKDTSIATSSSTQDGSNEENGPSPNGPPLHIEEKVADPWDSSRQPGRDAGVSDEVWNQLELDKKAAIAREEEYQRLQKEKVEEEKRIEEMKKAELRALVDEERRKLEQERIQMELARRERERILAALEEKRRKEMETQKKLRIMGPCPAGYQWIKQAAGYRCAGGSHFLSDGDVDRFCI